MGATFFLFVKATKIYKFKAKVSEIKKCPFCLWNTSADFSSNIMKKHDQMGVWAIFQSFYRAFNASNIIDIHKSLMKKHDIE